MFIIEGITVPWDTERERVNIEKMHLEKQHNKEQREREREREKWKIINKSSMHNIYIHCE